MWTNHDSRVSDTMNLSDLIMTLEDKFSLINLLITEAVLPSHLILSEGIYEEERSLRRDTTPKRRLM